VSEASCLMSLPLSLKFLMKSTGTPSLGDLVFFLLNRAPPRYNILTIKITFKPFYRIKLLNN